MDNVKKYYSKNWDKEEKPLMTKRILRLNADTKAKWVKENLLKDDRLETILAYFKDSDTKNLVSWLNSRTDAQLIELSWFNGNNMSQMTLENRHNVKLDKAAKRRQPQLKELANKLNIEL